MHQTEVCGKYTGGCFRSGGDVLRFAAWFVSCGDRPLRARREARNQEPASGLQSLDSRSKAGREGARNLKRPIRCFRGGNFHEEPPPFPGNGQKGGDGASPGAAVAETVRKRERRSKREASGEGSQSSLSPPPRPPWREPSRPCSSCTRRCRRSTTTQTPVERSAPRFGLGSCNVR